MSDFDDFRPKKYEILLSKNSNPIQFLKNCKNLKNNSGREHISQKYGKLKSCGRVILPRFLRMGPN